MQRARWAMVAATAVITAAAGACLSVSDLVGEGGDAGAREADAKDGASPRHDATNTHDAAAEARSSDGSRDSVADARGDRDLGDAPADVRLKGLPDGATCTVDGDVSCGNGCVDLATSVANCGACGHECRAGGIMTSSCTGGLCDVQTFAMNVKNPTGIAVNANTLYWCAQAGGTVESRPLVGTITTTIASGQGSPFAVALSGDAVFWTNQSSGTIMSVPIGGSTSTTLASGQTGASGIAVEGTQGTQVYWASTGLAQIDTVMVPAAGGAQTLVSGQAGAIDVAANGTTVFFTDGPSAGHSVLSAPASAGTPTTLIFSGDGGTAAGSAPAGIAIDSSHVYWADYGLGRITAANVTGAPTTVWMVSGQKGPVGVATDGVHVYWANNGNGTIVRASAADGGSVLTLATGQSAAWNVAVGATSVYWVTNATAGVVSGVSK
jgi:virginiamycin B lyase